MLKIYLFIIFIAVSFSCKKREPGPCVGIKNQNTGFFIKEVVGDTAFFADTVFRDNYVSFESPNFYQTVNWSIGNDPRNFTKNNFTLAFFNDLATIPVSFQGEGIANTLCFPTDDGKFSGTKAITTVEQFDRNFNTISPTVGNYKGIFIDKPNDSFIVRINYFDSSKYDLALTGSRNFYWISNIPNGFVDSTTDRSRLYPELRNGTSLEMGYKSFVFKLFGSKCTQGKGWLAGTALQIIYGDDYCGTRIFRGVKF